jgi:hypothetical protein
MVDVDGVGERIVDRVAPPCLTGMRGLDDLDDLARDSEAEPGATALAVRGVRDVQYAEEVAVGVPEAHVSVVPPGRAALGDGEGDRLIQRIGDGRAHADVPSRSGKA